MSVSELVLFEHLVVDVEHKEHLLNVGVEVSQVCCRERHVLITERVPLDSVSLLLSLREAAHAIAQPTKCISVVFESRFTELKEATERLW